MSGTTVTLANGLRGVVYPGDPAAEYVRALSRRGITEYYLSVATLGGGAPVVEDSSAPLVRLAIEDQVDAARSEQAPEECRHHWILEVPTEETEELCGVCKFCGAAQAFKARPTLHWVHPQKVDAEQRRRVERDWRDRYDAATDQSYAR